MAVAELARPVRAQLLQGHVTDVLRSLPSDTFQCVATSPPYYGLRDYGLPPQVWGGKPGHKHEWGDGLVTRAAGYEQGEKARWNHRVNGRGEEQERILSKEPGWTRKDVVQGQFCACGAWLGSLGLEPTPELYVEHLVSVFREVRRVLRPDGVCWVNLGDSYAGSGKGPTGWNGIGDQTTRQGFEGGLQRIGPQFHTNGQGRVANRKPKDLMLVPEMVALALQADGWWVRSRVPWVKRNAMPESQQDRPSTSVEYVFLLTKSRSYLWDAAAVRVEQSEGNHGLKAARERGYTDPGRRPKEEPHGRGNRANGSFHASKPAVLLPDGRNRRNGDWLIESFNGLLLDADGAPLCFVVNPAPFKDAHFATFPPKLVEPMLLAGSRPGDLVLDPFGGACTTALVAARLGRDSTSIDLNPEYLEMGRRRILADCPLFVEVC